MNLVFGNLYKEKNYELADVFISCDRSHNLAHCWLSESLANSPRLDFAISMVFNVLLLQS